MQPNRRFRLSRHRFIGFGISLVQLYSAAMSAVMRVCALLAYVFVTSPLLFAAQPQGIYLIDDQRLKLSRNLTGDVRSGIPARDVAGVLVQVCGRPWSKIGDVSCGKSLGSTTTDASGNFSFASFKGKGIYYLYFYKIGYQPLLLRVQLKPAAPPRFHRGIRRFNLI